MSRERPPSRFHSWPSNLPPPRAVLPKVKVHNLFDRCVRLELPLNGDIASTDRVDIGLNITFSEMWLTLNDYYCFGLGWKNFRINFGINRGWLHFYFEGMSSPTNERSFSFTISPVVTDSTRELTDEATISESQVRSAKASAGVAGEKSPSGSIEVGSTAQVQAGSKIVLKDRFGKDLIQIQENGDIDRPQWSFNCQTGDSFFIGNLRGRLATFVIERVPCSFAAQFKTSHQSIYVREVEVDGYAPDTERKKIASRLRARKLVWERARDYVSKATWRYGV